MQLRVRSYALSTLKHDHFYSFPDEEYDAKIEQIMQTQFELLKDEPLHMVEVEFLDDPTDPERFMRVGTAIHLMKMPMLVFDPSV